MTQTFIASPLLAAVRHAVSTHLVHIPQLAPLLSKLSCFVLQQEKEKEKNDKGYDPLLRVKLPKGTSLSRAKLTRERRYLCKSVVNGDVRVEKSYVPSSLHRSFTLGCTFFGEGPTSMSHA